MHEDQIIELTSNESYKTSPFYGIYYNYKKYNPKYALDINGKSAGNVSITVTNINKDVEVIYYYE